MTKPTTKRNPLRLRRTAPDYQRLPDHAYAALDELEKVRHDLHLDVDALIDATPYALLDRDSIGFSAGRTSDTPGRDGSALCEVCHGNDPGCPECGGGGRVPRVTHSDPTGETALRAGNGTAINWLNEAKTVRAQLVRVANRARRFYGFDPDHGRPDPDRPRENPKRIPLVEKCAFCREPAPTGRDDEGKSLLRRVDELPVHATPCYWTLAKQALRAGVSPGAHLKALSNVSNVKTAAS